MQIFEYFIRFYYILLKLSRLKGYFLIDEASGFKKNEKIPHTTKHIKTNKKFCIRNKTWTWVINNNLNNSNNIYAYCNESFLIKPSQCKIWNYYQNENNKNTNLFHLNENEKCSQNPLQDFQNKINLFYFSNDCLNIQYQIYNQIYLKTNLFIRYLNKRLSFDGY